MIENCKAINGGKSISWKCNNKIIAKDYLHVVYFLNISDKYIVVVEPDNEYSPDNAVVFNENGTEHVRVKNPFKDSPCFSDVYFIKGKIGLVAIGQRVNHICIIDVDGNVSKKNDTR